MDAMNNKTIWIRYWDTQHNSYYYYNETQGESVWESDFIPSKNCVVIDKSKDVESYSQYNTSQAFDNNYKDNNEEDDSYDCDDDKIFLINPPTETSKDIELVNVSVNQKNRKSFIASVSKRLVPELSVEDQTQFDILCYMRCLYLNAVLIESPLALLECAIRCVLLLILVLSLSVYHVGYSRQNPLSDSFMRKCIRELVICVATIPTLLIPGLILYAYLNYSSSNEWNLHPIPTIVGMVDVRRFLAITCNGGSSAANRYVRKNIMLISSSTNNDDIGSIPVVPKAQKKKKQKKKSSKQLESNSEDNTALYKIDCDDSWNRSEMIFVPLSIVSKSRDFLRGHTHTALTT
jgi:hypothetical protein